MVSSLGVFLPFGLKESDRRYFDGMSIATKDKGAARARPHIVDDQLYSLNDDSRIAHTNNWFIPLLI